MSQRRRVEIAVKPGSKREGFEIGEGGRIVARLRAPAREGRANEALVQLLAECLDVSRSAIRILTPRSRLKIVEIPAEADLARLTAPKE